MEIPKRLVESIKNNQCVIFIGSGLSSRLFSSLGKKYPSWSGLIKELNCWATENDILTQKENRLINDIIEKENLTMAAQILREKMNATEFSQFLDSIFRNDNRFDMIHRLILDLPFSYILTTNYDTVIESAYSYIFNKSLPTFESDQMGIINECMSNEKFFLFKMHGTYEREDTVILTKSNYQNLYQKSSYIDTLKNIFLSKNVLFVGFSYSDPDISYIISGLAHSFNSDNRMHYLLIPEGSYNCLEQEYMKRKERITIIEYDNSDGSHSGVDDFFRELITYIKKKEAL